MSVGGPPGLKETPMQIVAAGGKYIAFLTNVESARYFHLGDAGTILWKPRGSDGIHAKAKVVAVGQLEVVFELRSEEDSGYFKSGNSGTLAWQRDSDLSPAGDKS